MKIKRANKVFVPINITIESEEEALALFVIANFSPISDFMERHGVPAEKIRRELQDQIPSYQDLHRELRGDIAKYPITANG